MIPFPGWAVKLIAVLVLSVALFAGGWVKGAAHVQGKWNAEHGAMAMAAAEQGRSQAEATGEVVTKYVDRVQVVRGKTQTIVKEVPVYVSVQADTDCAINTGFVRLHDHSAANTIPGPSGPADADPSAVKLSTVAETVAGNYGACHENAEQLRALQGWVLSMGDASGR